MLGLFERKKKTCRAKILLVDDEPNLIDIMRRRLEPYGYEVITSNNGKEGLARATDEKPDLIVLDINMPVMNGHEMLERLRTNPDLQGTPVIMCSMSDRIQDVTMATSFNICAYVTKPFDYAELTGRIVEVLENRTSD